MISIDLDGVDETLRKLDRAGGAIREAARVEVKAALINIESEAKRRAPRSPVHPPPKNPAARTTGELKRSIRHRVDSGGLGGEVGTTGAAPYDVHQEFGTRRMIPRPFLFPAFEQERKKFVRALTKAINRVIRRENTR